jgi:SpoVK/Ycf46/Vps4 family AAA+-type ATPase
LSGEEVWYSAKEGPYTARPAWNRQDPHCAPNREDDGRQIIENYQWSGIAGQVTFLFFLYFSDIFHRYVGGSEKNIRDLFTAAKQDAKNEVSGLHIIIFDEIDSVCSRRGAESSSTQWSENVVNTLLSEIDGVNQLSNCLVIGMTNRLSVLDPAITRAGRLEARARLR